MAALPVCFSVPVELIMDVIDVVDVEEGRAYQKVISQVMVNEGLDSPVSHKSEAWYMRMEGGLFGPLRGFNDPFGGANGPILGNAAKRP
ncbi:hypothetical protein NL676_011146 [Syzygium grande]|nr:hypothetical protein NL676_011146 [Syzygium grande]